MMHEADERPANQLLRSMRSTDFEQLRGHLEFANLALREVVCEPGDDLPYIYFPITSMLSSIVLLSDGTAVEAATIGREGMAGASILVDERASPYRVIQQVEGEALRVDADQFRGLLHESEGLRTTVMRFVFTLLEQGGRNAACNLHHPVEARLARWLLQTSDRAGRSDFYITQEFLSEMVGPSRQTISRVAGSLQQAGLIKYSRGSVRLVDRPGLEERACDCYETYNAIYEKYMKMRLEKAAP